MEKKFYMKLYDRSAGSLLPQVAVEQKWDAQEFLENTCLKAGLKRDDWVDADVFKFQGQIFNE